jgi:predicted nucleic acid-binding protein
VATTATHLADTSALARLHHVDVLARAGPLLVGGRVATCALVDLEVLAAAAGPEHAEVLDERRHFPRVPCGDDALDRALVVQGALAAAGRHHEVSLVALVVAAAAELAGLTVLHHDPAFDLIAGVTRQPVEWVVPPGTVP